MAEHARSSQSLLIYLCLCLLLLSSSAHLAMSMDLDKRPRLGHPINKFSSEVALARRLYGNGSTDQQNSNASSNRSSDSPFCRLLLQILYLSNNQFTRLLVGDAGSAVHGPLKNFFSGNIPEKKLFERSMYCRAFSGNVPEDAFIKKHPCKMGLDVHGLQYGGQKLSRRAWRVRAVSTEGTARGVRMESPSVRNGSCERAGDQPAQADTM